MDKKELREDDVVLCTVKKIESTAVFVDIQGNGEGSIMMPEIAPGRIKNIREYVTPGKKIVCKVLAIEKGHPHLTLRRVTAKERNELQEKYKKEITFKSILKRVTKTPEKSIEKIKETYELADFFDEAKENPKIIEKFFSKSEAEVLAKLIAEKREKEKEAKKTISIKSFSNSGINDIKDALSSAKNLEIHYLGSSKFVLSAKALDFKDANAKIAKAIDAIKAKAKEKKLIFEEIEK